MPECIFCRWVKEKKEPVFESRKNIAFLGAQHHRGHVSVLPKKHYEDILEMTKTDYRALMEDVRKVASALRKVLKPDKLNYCILGNWVNHMHVHIYPRFKEDPDFGEPPYLLWKGEEYPPQLDLFSPVSEKILNKIKKILKK